jgi:hypothetical protein
MTIYLAFLRAINLAGHKPVAAINAWNRRSIAARLVPGTCQPAVGS